MILFINTADDEKVLIGIISDRKFIIKKEFSARYKQAEKLIPELEKLFHKAGLKLSDLNGILVVTGPGPFTALRIGVGVANALAWALKIRIAGLSLAEFGSEAEIPDLAEKKVMKSKIKSIVEPEYGREPNITMRH